jgi:hypothetical protein
MVSQDRIGIIDPRVLLHGMASHCISLACPAAGEQCHAMRCVAIDPEERRLTRVGVVSKPTYLPICLPACCLTACLPA